MCVCARFFSPSVLFSFPAKRVVFQTKSSPCCVNQSVYSYWQDSKIKNEYNIYIYNYIYPYPPFSAFPQLGTSIGFAGISQQCFNHFVQTNVVTIWWARCQFQTDSNVCIICSMFVGMTIENLVPSPSFEKIRTLKLDWFIFVNIRSVVS